MDITSDVSGLLKRQGSGLYHICFKTNDIEKEITRLKKDGWLLTKAPAPAVAFEGYKVAFLFHNNLGLIELVENLKG